MLVDRSKLTNDLWQKLWRNVPANNAKAILTKIRKTGPHFSLNWSWSSFMLSTWPSPATVLIKTSLTQTIKVYRPEDYAVDSFAVLLKWTPFVVFPYSPCWFCVVSSEAFQQLSAWGAIPSTAKIMCAGLWKPRRVLVKATVPIDVEPYLMIFKAVVIFGWTVPHVAIKKKLAKTSSRNCMRRRGNKYLTVIFHAAILIYVMVLVSTILKRS